MRKRFMDLGHMLNILIALEKKECKGAKVDGFINNRQTAVVKYNDKEFHIWDNGDEIGVEANTDNPKFAPLSYFSRPLNALTVSYRIAMLLDDKPINYDFAYSDEENNAFLKEYGRKEEGYEYMYAAPSDNETESDEVGEEYEM